MLVEPDLNSQLNGDQREPLGSGTSSEAQLESTLRDRVPPIT
jgi:hypothetical protein